MSTADLGEGGLLWVWDRRTATLAVHRYQERHEEAQMKGQVAPSSVVGCGRDIMGLHKDGTSMRLFIVIERLDLPQGSHYAPYLLIATLARVQGADLESMHQVRAGKH